MGDKIVVHPAERFDDLEVVSITISRFRQNAYVVVDAPTRDALLIDPGDEPELLIEYLDHHQLKLRRMLLTHGHFDHLGAAAALTSHFGVPAEAHEADRAVVRHAPTFSARLLGRVMPRPIVEYFADLGTLPWAGHQIVVEALAGHTPGSVRYSLPGMIFTGDSLLREKLGPTEYPESDRAVLHESVARFVRDAPVTARLWPGHGRPWSAADARVWWAG